MKYISYGIFEEVIILCYDLVHLLLLINHMVSIVGIGVYSLIMNTIHYFIS